MKSSSFFFLLIILVGCTSDKNTSNHIQAIDFYYFNSSPQAFSLRVTESDSVFLKRYFDDSATYFALLNKQLKQQYYSLINVSYFDKLDTVYESGDIDGEEYSLTIRQGAITKHIYVHSMKAPQKLDSLKNLFMDMKSSLSFVPVNRTIDFADKPLIPAAANRGF